MSFEIPEQAKYRLTGGIILISIAAFVLPGLMKKSNERFEESLGIHLNVPTKPNAPVMHIPTAQQVFETVKPVQKTQAPKVVARDVKVELSKAHHLTQASFIPKISLKDEILKSKPTIAKADANSSSTELPKDTNTKNIGYGVQLASFSHSENASFLVKRLSKLGYEAEVAKLTTKKGFLYQVTVGNLANKQKAIALQKQLAQNLQIEGMIISKG
jgi:cell division septation protein DedD